MVIRKYLLRDAISRMCLHELAPGSSGSIFTRLSCGSMSQPTGTSWDITKRQQMVRRVQNEGSEERHVDSNPSTS